MRILELFEDYSQNLETDLTNILVGTKGAGSYEINTQDVVDQLYSMGYSVNVNSIISLLSNNPVVLNATPEIINLTKPDGISADDEQDTAEYVSNMAQKATKIG